MNIDEGTGGGEELPRGEKADWEKKVLKSLSLKKGLLQGLDGFTALSCENSGECE